MPYRIFIDTAENFHPYQCEGQFKLGACVHCDRRKTESHDPATCALCDPEYDMQPNRYRAEAS